MSLNHIQVLFGQEGVRLTECLLKLGHRNLARVLEISSIQPSVDVLPVVLQLILHLLLEIGSLSRFGGKLSLVVGRL